jgi:hypothetical protein
MPDLFFDQTLDSVELTTTVELGRVASAHLTTAEAQTTVLVELGDPPVLLVLPPRIYNLTGRVRQTSGAILCFVGPPRRSVEWRMLSGMGTLTPFTTYTDDLGRASCRFDAAGIVGPVVVGVAYVP